MATTPNRTRLIPFALPGAVARRSSGVLIANYEGDKGQYTEELWSEGHAISRLNSHGNKGDIGGPFYHRKFTVKNFPQTVDITDSFGNNLYGAANCLSKVEINNEWTVLKNSIPEPSGTTLDAWGTTPIARVNPDNPASGVAAFLGEMHERLPSAFIQTLQGKASFFKSLGGDYLNAQFGWLPFVSDVKTMASAVVHSHDILAQFHKDAGKLVRRKYMFPLDETVTDITDVGAKSPWPLSSTLFHGSGGQRTRTRKITKTTWFSGAFTYTDGRERGSLPFESEYREAQHLLGVALTPDILWQLTPWSWLTDWWLNIGDILTNVRAFVFDGLAMPYGYIMYEQKARSHIVMDIPHYWVDGSDHHSETVLQLTVQNRRQATPWGFGLDWNDFSFRQLAILAALGLQRVF